MALVGRFLEGTPFLRGSTCTNLWRQTDRKKKCFAALLIIFCLGALITAGCGLASIGSHQGWWAAGSLSNLSQIKGIIMVATGAGGGLISFAIGLSIFYKKRNAHEGLLPFRTWTLSRNESFINSAALFLQNEKRIGKDAWKEHLNLDIGQEPPLPDHLLAQLGELCKVTGDQKTKVDKTHILALVPSQINGKPYSLETIVEALRKNEVSCLIEADAYKICKDSIPPRPYWILMTASPIPKTQQCSYQKKKEQVEESGYQVPNMLEVTICLAFGLLAWKPGNEEFNLMTNCAKTSAEHPEEENMHVQALVNPIHRLLRIGNTQVESTGMCGRII
jgi:hypothetical protein